MIDSSVYILWKPIGFLDNISKYNYMFSHLCCVLQNEYASIAKSFKYGYWLSELLGRWSMVGGLVGKWLVGQWFIDLIKPRKKHVWGIDFACALWSRF